MGPAPPPPNRSRPRITRWRGPPNDWRKPGPRSAPAASLMARARPPPGTGNSRTTPPRSRTGSHPSCRASRCTCSPSSPATPASTPPGCTPPPKPAPSTRPVLTTSRPKPWPGSSKLRHVSQTKGALPARATSPAPAAPAGTAPSAADDADRSTLVIRANNPMSNVVVARSEGLEPQPSPVIAVLPPVTAWHSGWSARRGRPYCPAWCPPLCGVRHHLVPTGNPELPGICRLL
jgi:hypothetical protein